MQYFAFEYLGVTAMEYLHLLPSLEVLLFNLITLNHCLKRKYTMLKTVIILFCVVIVFSVLPGLFIKTDMFDGSGKFSVFGFIFNHITPFVSTFVSRVTNYLTPIIYSF